MKRARFCFITTFYPPYHFGGDAIGVRRLAAAVARRGHDVTVIHDADAYTVLGGGAPNGPAPDDAGVRVVTLRSRLPMVSTLLTQQAGRPVVNGARIGRLLDEGRYDVIVFNNVSLIGGPGLLRYGAGAVKLYLAHEHWLVCPTHVLWRDQRERCDSRACTACQLRYHRPPQLWRHTGLLERSLAHVDAFVAMSEFSRAKHQEFGFTREMHVLPQFLPDNEIVPLSGSADSPQARPYFLFAGRLEIIKGLDDVIPLLRRYPDADLLIAGEGTHGATLRSLAANLPNVKFLGRLPSEDLSRYYKHAVAAIVPSVGYETFGITLIESFQRGTPVIARRVGPMAEIVERAGGGELFESVDELLAAMSRLQNDRARRDRLGHAGALAVQQEWSERAVVPRYFDLIRRVASRKSMPALADALSVSRQPAMETEVVRS
jgi:glycosyltransferase involved in cell wall biosynthesis